ncbi:MAG: threonine synthase, partial [Nitrospirae bacterium]
MFLRMEEMNAQSTDEDRMCQPWKGLLHHYREFLPVTDKTPIITLNEGNTPFIKARNIPEKLGLNIELYFKYDGANPTGSFKDRGMTMAISKAIEEGAKAVICASTGNTSASAAAYAARAGIQAFVLIPEGKIALGKLVQALMHGAVVVQVKGNFDQALAIVRQMVEKYPITLVNSINPYRLE